MQGGQLDLFDASGARHEDPAPQQPPPRLLTPTAPLTDAALIAAIPDASQATCHALADDAARRKLAAAVPALDALCRRFKGFGRHTAVAEQMAALQALAAIGGAEAAAVVRRIIVEQIVSGPGEREAMRAAAALHCILPEQVAAVLLRHPDPATRALACRCAPPVAQVPALLVGLLDDLNPDVATAAATTLARMGRVEGRARLVHLLRHAPDRDVIEAVTPVADDECLVLLGRIARRDPALHDAALTALEVIATPRAAVILAGISDPGARHPGSS